jgi:hypothetical protein
MDVNGFIVVCENSWKTATPEQRDEMIYSTMKSVDGRLKKLESKALFNKGVSGVAGLFGGALAALGLKWWG